MPCGAEVRDSVLLHGPGPDVIGGRLGFSLIEDLHVIDIEKEVYATAAVEALFDARPGTV